MTPDIWAVVPAAGVGRRMGAEIPKQYLPLLGKTVLEQTLSQLARLSGLRGIVVVVGKEDGWWPGVYQGLNPKLRDLVQAVPGGQERCHSVLNGLSALPEASDQAWVLVHDAARPCVDAQSLNALIEQGLACEDGAILGVPVRDTMKRARSDGRIEATVPRETLWHALTPQFFPLKRLRNALELALKNGCEVTDEASAMELAGAHPRLVEGRHTNLKITRPEDLDLAAFFLGKPGDTPC